MVPPTFKCGRSVHVIMKPDVQLRATQKGPVSLAAASVSELQEALGDCTLVPLFGNEDRITASVAAVKKDAETDDVPDLAKFYTVAAPEDRLEAVAERLQKVQSVDGAYVVEDAVPPVYSVPATPLSAMPDPPSTTPDFSNRQRYLRAAPEGVDADYASTLLGGRGTDVSVIDVEGGWNLTHEDLGRNQGGVITGVERDDWVNHGTAVLGVIGGDRNGFGVRGIAPEAYLRCSSIWRTQTRSATASAIRAAADRLRRGDIILLEVQYPKTNREIGDYLPVEWWEADFAAIQYAVRRGIVVVEAAGNGYQNLDDPAHNTPLPGFPSSWTNPLTRRNRDSGAILVGAGASTFSDQTARSRLGFSNYGSAVDAQGWGEDVMTCGYGCHQGGPDEDLHYTNVFNGTSSASPCVVGALACVQGILKANNRAVLTPQRARALLRSTGSPQAGSTNERIGNLPNVRQMVDALF